MNQTTGSVQLMWTGRPISCEKGVFVDTTKTLWLRYSPVVLIEDCDLSNCLPWSFVFSYLLFPLLLVWKTSFGETTEVSIEYSSWRASLLGTDCGDLLHNSLTVAGTEHQGRDSSEKAFSVRSFVDFFVSSTTNCSSCSGLRWIDNF